jgi:hypothetical protein
MSRLALPFARHGLSHGIAEGGGAVRVAPPHLVGSVIGRGFSYGLLRAVAGMEDGPLRMALERLAEADILLVEGLPPESDYRFKHALIQGPKRTSFAPSEYFGF